MSGPFGSLSVLSPRSLKPPKPCTLGATKIQVSTGLEKRGSFSIISGHLPFLAICQDVRLAIDFNFSFDTHGLPAFGCGTTPRAKASKILFLPVFHVTATTLGPILLQRQGGCRCRNDAPLTQQLLARRSGSGQLARHSHVLGCKTLNLWLKISAQIGKERASCLIQDSCLTWTMDNQSEGHAAPFWTCGC